jgi:hypothetical protein
MGFFLKKKIMEGEKKKHKLVINSPIKSYLFYNMRETQVFFNRNFFFFTWFFNSINKKVCALITHMSVY